MYRIDPGSSVPVYQQLLKQIERSIFSGSLSDGDKLPSIREMATALRINPNTVAKTYRQLEHLGLVVSRKGMGIYVRIGEREMERNRTAMFMELTDEYVSKSKALGMSPEEMIRELKSRLTGVDDDD